ncbi:MAG: hypothetical protein R2699_01990 [Acidimicrobiales bacterium]
MAAFAACRNQLASLVSELSGLSPDAADAVLSEAIALEQLAHAAVLGAVSSAMQGRPWKRCGERGAADNLARRCGTSKYRANQILTTATQLDDLPEVASAVRTGVLSAKQAQLAAQTGIAAPDRQSEILDAFQTLPWVGARQVCDRITADADPRSDTERHDAARRARRVTRHNRPDGTTEITWTHTTAAGAELWGLLQPFIDHHHRCARNTPVEDREPAEALYADALLTMARAAATGTLPDGIRPPASGANAKVIVHIDYRSWTRGTTSPGEVCEIEGLGPIPVTAAAELTNDAFITAVIHDTTDIRGVVHYGRKPTALQATYLQAKHRTCAVAGCTNTTRLEYDHTPDWAQTRHTTVRELTRLCEHHHNLKSTHGWTYTPNPDNTLTPHPPNPHTPPTPSQTTNHTKRTQHHQRQAA